MEEDVHQGGHDERGEGAGGIKRTLSIYGTFGGGTATVQVSSDNGTTWITVTDSAGDIAVTANAVRNVDIVSTSYGEDDGPMLISVLLAGATSPVLTFDMYQLR